jgi:hypothetical protein
VEVWIRSTPEGARVVRRDEDLGNTPARLLLGPEDRWTLTLSAPGHEPRTLRVSAAQREVNVVLTPAPTDVATDPAPDTPQRPRADPSRADEPEGSSGRSRPGARSGSGGSGAGAAAPRTDNRDPWDTDP